MRRRTGRCGEERSSVIPAALYDGKGGRKEDKVKNWTILVSKEAVQ